MTEIGLELLAHQPIHELALDEVADRAGISRTLLFHYFPTKSDYYAAVVERAGQRLLSGGKAPTGTSGTERVRSLISGYLRLVESSRDLYARLVRGAAGGDPAVMRTIDDLRTALIPTWVAAAGRLPRLPMIRSRRCWCAAGWSAWKKWRWRGTRRWWVAPTTDALTTSFLAHVEAVGR